MFREKTKLSLLSIFGALTAFALLLTACGTPATPSIPTQPAPTAIVSQPTSAPTQPQPTQALPTGQGPSLTLDLNGIAQGSASEVIAAVPASANGPIWLQLPEYTMVTLSGYPIANSLLKPQIFIYPLADLATFNAGAGKIAADLQALLKDQQVGQNLPFMPLFNASQVLHAQVNFLDFKNGKGVRFLTQFDQALLPINNHELIYTFQGVTSDGKYYVAAVLPVNLASLPADEKVTGQEPPEFTSDFPKYLENVTATLNAQSPSAFTPDLSKLDALIQSIEVK